MSRSDSDRNLEEYNDNKLLAQFDLENPRNKNIMVLFNKKTDYWKFSPFEIDILCRLLPKYVELFKRDKIWNDDVPLELRTDPRVVGFFLLMEDKINDDDEDADDAAKFSMVDYIKCKHIDTKYKNYIGIKQYVDDCGNSLTHEKVTIDWERYAHDADAKLANATAEIALLRAANARLCANSTSTLE
jgi:hypothetical protein